MAEFVLIGAMFALILVICTIAVVFFVRQYRKEMREKAENQKRKAEKIAKN